MGKHSQAVERIELLSGPGAKEAEQGHPRPATDFALDDQRTRAVFRQVDVRWHTCQRDEDEQLGASSQMITSRSRS